MCGIVNPNLYRVWEESGRIKIRLEVKFEVLLKMKPHKIQRLEFVSDKTEAGIATGRSCDCPLKRNIIGWSSPWKGSHGCTKSSMDGHGSLPGEEEKGEERSREGRLLSWREETRGMGEATWGGYSVLLLLVSCWLVYVGKRKEKRKKRKGKKEREKEKEKKKMEKNFKPKNFQGEK
jgi:hypothetical protein